MNSAPARLPPWLKVRLPGGPSYERLKQTSHQRGLATVCEQARCPNTAECWGGGTATFMVMGDTCTRGCRFCAVKSEARPPSPAADEPMKLAEALFEMRLEYAVLTTVCRDDLPDQGAGHLASCIRAIKAKCPGLAIEMLAQDFRGDKALIERVIDAGPDVFAHNIETVERLAGNVRDARAGYRQSLGVLAHAKRYRTGLATKSSLMLGLGESQAEVRQALEDLRGVGCEIVTLGQYLRPTSAGRSLPVARFLRPEEFDALGALAESLGFARVACGPFVRSSYRAAELFAR